MPSISVELAMAVVSFAVTTAVGEPSCINGGWATPNEPLSTVCTVERRSFCSSGDTGPDDCMSPDEFRSVYESKKPVLIDGLIHNWPAFATFQKTELLMRYGKKRVMMHSSAIEHTAGAQIFHPFFAVKQEHITLRTCLERLANDTHQFLFDYESHTGFYLEALL